MFERIKAYKNLKKMDKFLNGVKIIGEITNNEDMVITAKETLYKNDILRKEIIFNRKKAREYNLECIRKGF